MVCKTFVCATPEELSAQLNNLLANFDLYEIQNNTVTAGGKPQFIAYVYGKEKEPEPEA